MLDRETNGRTRRGRISGLKAAQLASAGLLVYLPKLDDPVLVAL